MACLESSGTRGGIMMLWDSRIWKGEVLETGTYTLTCKFESQLQDISCHMTGVYAPNCYVERRLVWEEIGYWRTNRRTDGFIDRIREWWDSFDYIGTPDYILASKSKALKHKLKEWNRSEQGSLGQQGKNVLEKLAVVENIATDRVLTEDEATEKATLLLKPEGTG
ncbi:hypothetical protein MTR67_012411 [Solanum verrucosum]|uniref:Uncharacterized protein n=1 Tax=Solanum verrucosum TaxID=315347 RepID=A0AAF0TGZ4_SOLVR|nr:hypothetical protein MTR67_012411 [Solanum verrucosum]